MSTAGPPVEGLMCAVRATAGIVAGIRADQWGGPTGCPGWDVRALLNHLVGGNVAAAAVLTDQEPPDHAVDQLGDDPLIAYEKAGEALCAAFAQPEVLGKVVTVPAGTVPGIVVLHLRITELLVHGWDLAHATGQPTSALPADLAEQEHTFSVQMMQELPPGRSPFAPPQPAPDSSPAIDRLAALLGRTVELSGEAPS